MQTARVYEKGATCTQVVRNDSFTWRFKDFPARIFEEATEDGGFIADEIPGPTFEAVGKLWRCWLFPNGGFLYKQDRYLREPESYVCADYCIALALELLTPDVPAFQPRVTFSHRWTHWKDNSEIKLITQIQGTWSTVRKEDDPKGGLVRPRIGNFLAEDSRTPGLHRERVPEADEGRRA